VCVCVCVCVCVEGGQIQARIFLLLCESPLIPIVDQASGVHAPTKTQTLMFLPSARGLLTVPTRQT
jgi:hypothetical protein